MDQDQQLSKEEVLKQLRLSILESVKPLVDSEGLETEDRLRIIMQLAQNEGSSDLYRKAFDLIKSVENNEEKLQYYMELLNFIELELDNLSDNNIVNDMSAAPSLES